MRRFLLCARFFTMRRFLLCAKFWFNSRFNFQGKTTCFYKEKAVRHSSNCLIFCDPSAVTKFFIVSCATESYEMCFCGTVPQIVVHFDL